MEHPGVDEMRAFAVSALDEPLTEALLAHVARCEPCRDRLDLVVAAMAYASAAPQEPSHKLPEAAGLDIRHRHLPGNDARLDAALDQGMARQKPPTPRAVRQSWFGPAAGAGLAAAAALLLVFRGPTSVDEVAPPQLDLPSSPRAQLRFDIEGQGVQTRGMPAPTTRLVQADVFATIEPGQGARLTTSDTTGGWLYLFSLENGALTYLPGQPAGGTALPPGEEVTVPSPALPAWRAAGEPGDMTLAVVVTSAPLEPTTLSGAELGARPWQSMQSIVDGEVYRAVLRFGSNEQ